MVTVRKLQGVDVITADSINIGDFAGAEVDTTSWGVTHLHVALRKEVTEKLGFKKPFLGNVVICIPTNLVKSIGDVILLDRQLEQIKELKECKFV